MNKLAHNKIYNLPFSTQLKIKQKKKELNRIDFDVLNMVSRYITAKLDIFMKIIYSKYT